MTRRTRAVVTVTESDRPVRLSPDVSATIEVETGDAVRVLDGAGGSAVRRVDVDGSLEPGSVRLHTAVGDQLAVESGDAVLVESASPTPARAVELKPVPALSLAGGEERIREAIGRRPIAEGDELEASFIDGSFSLPLRVTETRPSGLVVVQESTRVTLSDGPAPTAAGRRVEPVAADAVGGYGETIEALEDAVVAPLRDTGRFDAFGGMNRAGVLLAGPSGVGKTHLLGHAVWRANATVHSVDARALSPQDPEAVRSRLRAAGAAVSGYGPGVVHVDGVDAFLDDSADSPGAAEFREWLQGVADESGVVVVGEVRELEQVPATVLRGELLARTIRVRPPTDQDRAAILEVLLRDTPVDPSVDVADIARRAFGYVAADLLTLRSRAVEVAAARSVEGRPVLTRADFREALSATGPGELSGTYRQVPSTLFDDIGGLDLAKRELRRAVEWPIRYPDLFDELGIEPARGVLLYGPPGTGKTMLARAVASTTDANFVSVSGPELMNKYVGESERAVRTVFEQARSSAPTVVFFDEVDSIGAMRSTDGDGSAPERVVSQLLTEMDGLSTTGDVTVVGSTNRPDRLDDALLRPGRFDRLVPVPLPDETDRAEIFRVHTREQPTVDIDYGSLAARTEGYTGSDIAAVVREAGLLALEEGIGGEGSPDGQDHDMSVRQEHLERAVELVDPSVSGEERSYYESVGDRLGYSNDRPS